MQELFENYGAILLQGTIDTIYMTFAATIFAYVLGMPMGVILSITKKGGLYPKPVFHSVFSGVVNIIRSLPFFVLLFFLIPFTQFVVGTAIGNTGALVPLVIASCAFVARMVETSLEEVDSGVVDAAKSMGASNLQIIMKVFLVESFPGLVRGFSISAITILGYTAITGAIGAGGLGELAVRYGFHRFKYEVMYATVIILIILVAVTQGVIGTVARRIDKKNR